MLLYRCYLIYFTSFLAVITASCGFKPLYNIDDPIDFSIQTIEIGEIKVSKVENKGRMNRRVNILLND